MTHRGVYNSVDPPTPPSLRPKEPQPMGLQPKDISLFESLPLVFFEALF